ncbi:hypothetical protein SJAG_03099 [Schizosaccharomyces japonicus yFS275]|uniref:Mitochondrial zinc maintenance protein 1, mitochondrial n=1 Tax=Schizosaccharomyces japonicus (strain yFS275 / FY16936) TaxID=402676 RepID=B6K3B5_SCHJY|nr:hypothetical protein SJAG_03099 [Schizosaccharomyces japonicus yFS275]EEB07972.1 hypothetical protein SJAG_03099 [Schizosaccharomyces japonicus yFS275]
MERAAARACYRKLFRSTTAVFQRDKAMLEAARQRIRQEFIQNRNLPPEELQVKVDWGNQIAEFLSKNLVQAEKQVDGSYKLNIRPSTDLSSDFPPSIAVCTRNKK